MLVSPQPEFTIGSAIVAALTAGWIIEWYPEYILVTVALLLQFIGLAYMLRMYVLTPSGRISEFHRFLLWLQKAPPRTP